jgi:aminoglycoside phosphotransferase (APT) family kinase protein
VTPHGFGDDAETRRLLRSRPPRQALDWAGDVLGGTVTATRALRGGTASAVHLLTVAGATDTRVVLRRYVRPDEPGMAEREARALAFAAHLEVPTPRLLAADTLGERAGAPAVLMSWLPGAVRWWPPDPGRWLAGLAALLPAIHAAPLPPRFPSFTPYRQDSYQPPAWARWPRIWARAVEICRGPVPGPRVFLHRDFHPGNVRGRAPARPRPTSVTAAPTCSRTGQGPSGTSPGPGRA